MLSGIRGKRSHRFSSTIPISRPHAPSVLPVAKTEPSPSAKAKKATGRTRTASSRPSERAFLVGAHQPRIADDIDRHDGR
jgi:hypothetical protein